MPKEFNDWTDFLAGKFGEPEHPLSKPVTVGPVLKKGEVPRRPSDLEVRNHILKGAPPQPTDQEMFGRFEVTEEQARAAQENWKNTFNNFFNAAKKPVEKQPLAKSWGRGPVNQKDRSQLTEEELKISEIPVDPSFLGE